MLGHVCVVGSANLDLVARTGRLPAPGETVTGHDFFAAAGGKGLNQAVAAARAGARVSFVGAVGDDDAGRALLTIMTSDGLDTTHVRVLAGVPTGRALIAVADDSSNLIVVVPGANGRLDAAAVRSAAAVIGSAEVLLVQHEIPDSGIEEALRHAKAAGAVTVLNPAPARPVPPAVLALVDILVPNEHEYPKLGDVSAVAALVVTEGERGALVTAGGRPTRRVAAFAVEAIDSVAAGDAFCGALAASLAAGLDLDDALVRASAAGALATLRPGAVPSLPTARQIDELIARR